MSGLSIVLDTIGLLSGFNARGYAVSKSLDLHEDIWKESLDSWNFLGNYTTGGGVCLTIIQKLKEIL